MDEATENEFAYLWDAEKAKDEWVIVRIPNSSGTGHGRLVVTKDRSQALLIDIDDESAIEEILQRMRAVGVLEVDL